MASQSDRDSAVYAVIERPGRVWAIASIHGDAARLATLHAALEARFQPGDRIVYLGNYLGVGEDAGGTVDELLKFRRYLLTVPGCEPWDIVYLRGAQEEMWHKLLQIQFAPEPRPLLDWMLQYGIASTLRAYGSAPEIARQRCRDGPSAMARWTNELRQAVHLRKGHDELIAGLRRYAVSDNALLLFVSAGLDPSKELARQGDAFWWNDAGLEGLQAPYGGFRRIVRGFERAHGGRREDAFVVSLDGGCGHGGPLNAACLNPEAEVVDWLTA